MKPVYQEFISGDGVIGDCFRACVASLLDADIQDVPHFLEVHRERMMEAAREWLFATHGIGLLTVHLDCEEHSIVYIGTPKTLCIASIPSPNIDGGSHAVVAEVAEFGLSLRFKFDPRPDGKACSNADGYFLPEHAPTAVHFLTRVI